MAEPGQIPITQPPLADSHPARWRILALVSVAELLGMSLWFAASAVSAQYRELWSLSASEAGWLTTIVSLGFVAGTALSALLNLADVVPTRRLFAISALAGAVANALVLTTGGLGGALFWRFVTGACLAGVYPPAMKMISTWFRSRRGLAVGTIVGALTVGKAFPYLVHAIPGAGIVLVTLASSAGALVAAALVRAGYRDGPYPFPPRPFSWGLVGEVVRERRWRLATGGYLGHMIELYRRWVSETPATEGSGACEGGATSIGANFRAKSGLANPERVSTGGLPPPSSSASPQRGRAAARARPSLTVASRSDQTTGESAKCPILPPVSRVPTRQPARR